MADSFSQPGKKTMVSNEAIIAAGVPAARLY